MKTLDLDALKSVDIRTVDPSTLEDISTVKINPDLPFIEKAIDFLRQIRNPYCFTCGDMIMKVSHAETTTSLEDCMEGFYRSL